LGEEKGRLKRITPSRKPRGREKLNASKRRRSLSVLLSFQGNMSKQEAYRQVGCPRRRRGNAEGDDKGREALRAEI